MPGDGGGPSEREQLAGRPAREKLRISDSLLPSQAQAAVFDMDGTLLNSNDRRVESWSAACAKRGLAIDKAKYIKETGRSGQDIVDSLCAEQGKDLPSEERQALVKEEGEIFTNEGLGRSGLIPIVLDIVEAAKARGLKLAVCSGGQAEVVEQALRERGIADLFDAVVTSKDAEHAKPDPDVYLLAAERLGVPPSDCVAYEDAEQGIRSAEAAGYLQVVDVTRLQGHPERDERHS